MCFAIEGFLIISFPTLGLPIHSHTLHRHRHASCAAATTRELVALEGDHAFRQLVDVDLVVDHVGSRNDADASLADGLQGVLVAAVADELARGETEEVAAAVPLLTGTEDLVATTTVDGLQVDAEAFQGHEQVGLVLADGFLAVDGDVEGLECVAHHDGFVGHALVEVDHVEHHVEVDERLGLLRQLLEDQMLDAGSFLEMFHQGLDAMHVGARPQSAQDDVVADDLHIAAFHRADAMGVVGQDRVDDLGLEQRV